MAPLLYRIRAVLSVDPAAGSCGVTSACHFAMVASRRIWLRLKADQTLKDQAPGATFLKFVVGPKTGWVPSITSSLVMVAMLTLLGTGMIINGARLSLCSIAMVDARSALRYDVLIKVGFVIWERGPTSNPPRPWRQYRCTPEGQLEVLQLLGLQPDMGGPGPAPQPLGAGEENRLCRARAIPVPGF